MVLNVLITGGSGYIGSNLIKHLLTTNVCSGCKRMCRTDFSNKCCICESLKYRYWQDDECFPCNLCASDWERKFWSIVGKDYEPFFISRKYFPPMVSGCLDDIRGGKIEDFDNKEERMDVNIINLDRVSYDLENIKNDPYCKCNSFYEDCYTYYKVDLLDKKRLEHVMDVVFKRTPPDIVIHMASLKSVPESLDKPLLYYYENINGIVNLLDVLKDRSCKRFIFSSSAAVYGEPHVLPIKEDHPLNPTNPYGRTKMIIEDILKDFSRKYNDWNIISLRYFNPIGGEGLEYKKQENVMPVVLKTIMGEQPVFKIFGGDYPKLEGLECEQDGTPVRDFVHINDIAEGHRKAIFKIIDGKGYRVYNLGSGTGTTVKSLVSCIKEGLGDGIEFDYEICERRNGDVYCLYADVTKAKDELGYDPRYKTKDIGIDIVRSIEMIRSIKSE